MFKFVSKFKYACLAVVVIAILAVVMYFVKGLNLDISFQGGTQIQVQVTDNKTDLDALDAKIEKACGSLVNIQRSESFDVNVDEERYFIVVKVASEGSLSSEKLAEVKQIIRDDCPIVESEADPFEIQNVAPSIGSELLASGLKGLLAAVILMILYIAIRFSKISGLQAGLSTIFALIIDAGIVFAVYVIFNVAFNETFIAAILTIIGYSINDKIIIFDRIRELTISGRRKLAHEEIVDLAINETLPRTINTTITTLISLVVCLVLSLVFRIDSIVEFAFPLIIGVTLGTCTSMFIATPTFAKWMDSKTVKRK